MIIAESKPLHEIVSSLVCYEKVLVLGCGTCVTVCMTGGNKEARALIHDLNNSIECYQKLPCFEYNTIERQCERDIVENYLELPDKCDAVLSLACGAGVQTLSSIYKHIPVIPALNTSFLGATVEPGIWTEQCCGCGDCILAFCGGICPVTRCAKKIFNGPCGGSKNGKCEISEEVDCAWALIIDRLRNLNQLYLLDRVISVRDWSRDRGGGPRKLVHNH